MLRTNPLTSLLLQQPFLVLDGSMASELENQGGPLCDSLWSARRLLDNPQHIEQAHYAYFKAGAQCTLTASYQATLPGFAAQGITTVAAEALIRDSVTLAANARHRYLSEHPQAGPLLIAGSVGPYGAFLADGSEYRGDYQLTDQAYQAFHLPRIRALIEAGVDLLACETLPCFDEIRALAELLSHFPRTHAWFSFTLRDAQHLSDGTPLSEVITLLECYPQVIAVGVNCVAPALATEALRHLHALTWLPLVVYPNRGEHYDATAKAWQSEEAQMGDPMADLDAWLAAGAKLIGGCCRTHPADIARLRQRRDQAV